VEKGVEELQEEEPSKILELLTGQPKPLAPLAYSPQAEITNLELQITLLTIAHHTSSCL